MYNNSDFVHYGTNADGYKVYYSKRTGQVYFEKAK